MYHLVYFGWKKHGVGRRMIRKRNKQPLKYLVKIIHTWVYSFARPGYCEDEGECNLSKKLLYYYAKSDEVFKVLKNTDNVNRTLEWLRMTVFLWEDHFFHYSKKNFYLLAVYKQSS